MTKDVPDDCKQQQVQEFEHGAGQRQRGMLSELAYFLSHNKKWWLTPIILVLILLGLLVVLAGTGPIAPFIYTLF